jgi:hypothetical protein
VRGLVAAVQMRSLLFDAETERVLRWIE